jgi:hypothetical protein
MTKKIFHLFLFFVLTTFVAIGCSSGGGGGGGGDNDSSRGTAPIIDDVIFHWCNSADINDCWDESDFFFVGEFFDFVMYCQDPDLDIDVMYSTLFILTNNGYVLFSGPDVETLPVQEAESTFYYPTPNLQAEPPAGDFRVEFRVEDAEGNMSNVFTSYIEILP